jgi:predicted RNase H-like nuclease (RuvC/YqgF family)
MKLKDQYEAEVSAYKNQIKYFKNELQSTKDDLNTKEIMWAEEKTALSKEILQKEKKIEELTNELCEIRNLNKELQKSAIQHFGQIKGLYSTFLHLMKHLYVINIKL